MGRGSAASLYVSDTNVSRKHCRLVWVQPYYFLVDLGSQNGTRLVRAIGPAMETILDHLGAVPLPPYITAVLDDPDVEGVIIPANTINTIVRSVPIVGELIAGGGKGALLGIDFTMTGPVDDPDVDVDTASILTPGIIKNFFGGILD